jgi:Ala-tRNA(Pro) deacylase
MISAEEKKVYEVLDELNISYQRYEHEPVFTVDEVNELGIDIPGQHCKNLFLRNKKGDTQYLVIVDDSKKVDIKALAMQIESTKLSFASPDRLYKYLGLTPGSVSVFGLLNDIEHCVEVVLDRDMANSQQIGFHPNTNKATVVIKYTDFEKFIKWCGNKTTYIDMANPI